jgi:hypothetical protein
MDIKDLINKYENLSKALEGLVTEEIVNNFLADLRKLQSENGKLPIPHVSDTVCDETNPYLLSGDELRNMEEHKKKYGW